MYCQIYEPVLFRPAKKALGLFCVSLIFIIPGTAWKPAWGGVLLFGRWVFLWPVKKHLAISSLLFKIRPAGPQYILSLEILNKIPRGPGQHDLQASWRPSAVFLAAKCFLASPKKHLSIPLSFSETWQSAPEPAQPKVFFDSPKACSWYWIYCKYITQIDYEMYCWHWM